MVNDTRGFTIIESMVAIMLLSVGLLGLLGASTQITRMLGRGDRAAMASSYAQERLELLRASGCALMSGGSDTREGMYDYTWTVSASAGGNTRRIQLIATYPGVPGQTRVDTLETSVLCVR